MREKEGERGERGKEEGKMRESGGGETNIYKQIRIQQLA